MSDKQVSFSEMITRHPGLLDILQIHDVVLYCHNRQTGKDRKARFSALFRNNGRFWESSTWDFYLHENTRRELNLLMDRERLKLQGNIKGIKLDDMDKSGREDLPPSFGKEYEEVVNMSMDERSERIVRSINSLDEALEQRRVSSHDISAIMTDAAIYSTLINKVSIDEMCDQDDHLSQRHLQQVTSKTEELMGTFVKALSRDYNLNHTAEAILAQTDGVTSRHMLRVFILTMRFLDDLRHEFEYAGLYRRLQSRFHAYLPLYEPLRERFSLSRFDSSVILPQPPRFNEKIMEEIILGILMHDLGKNRNLLYFEGGEDYNRKIIEDHAFDGYFMLMKKTLYKNSIASVAGIHHEYYGHEQGYGVFRENYQEHRDKIRNHSFDAIMSNNYGDLTSFKSLSYMPAKILEIVDVYDALVDKERLYKAPMSTGEALIFMRKNMIDKDFKLDPILFDLFVKFLKKAKLI